MTIKNLVICNGIRLCMVMVTLFKKS